MAVGHREDDIGRVRAGKRQLHDLFERNLLSLDYPRPRVDDDLERLGRLGRGDEPFDARSGEVNDIGGLDQQIFAPTAPPGRPLHRRRYSPAHREWRHRSPACPTRADDRSASV